LTLNTTSGLPDCICRQWKRKSFINFPAELINFSRPKSKAATAAAAVALIEYLKNKQVDNKAEKNKIEDITVGAWIQKFTIIETSPRTDINAAGNRPYSENTVDIYLGYFNTHIKDDPFTRIKMAEVEEEDALAFIRRMSLKKLIDGRPMGGTRTFLGVIAFVRMTFKNFASRNHRWIDPFQYVKKPKYHAKVRDFLSEDEMIKLFYPGVLQRPIEIAVCAVIFLSGLRRSEVSALRPEDLDWHTPKIVVRRAWQNFANKSKRVLGPPKSKRERVAPFDPVLQDAIRKLWAENGRHEFVFSHKDGTVIGPNWTKINLSKWLDRAGINTEGREIVPHSARHSLASMLEEKKVPIRYIQELLGHSSMKTTKTYLHSTERTIRDIGSKINDVMSGQENSQIIPINQKAV
jgi:integrase